MKIKISDLDFISVRFCNCMSGIGIDYLEQLQEFSEKDLLSMRQVGRKTIRDVKDCLKRHGMSLKGDHVEYFLAEVKCSTDGEIFIDIQGIGRVKVTNPSWIEHYEN